MASERLSERNASGSTGQPAEPPVDIESLSATSSYKEWLRYAKTTYGEHSHSTKPFIFMSVAKEDTKIGSRILDTLNPALKTMSPPYKAAHYAYKKNGTLAGDRFKRWIAENMWKCRAAIFLWGPKFIAGSYDELHYTLHVEAPFLVWRSRNHGIPLFMFETNHTWDKNKKIKLDENEYDDLHDLIHDRKEGDKYLSALLTPKFEAEFDARVLDVAEQMVKKIEARNWPEPQGSEAVSEWSIPYGLRPDPSSAAQTAARGSNGAAPAEPAPSEPPPKPSPEPASSTSGATARMPTPPAIDRTWAVIDLPDGTQHRLRTEGGGEIIYERLDARLPTPRGGVSLALAPCGTLAATTQRGTLWIWTVNRWTGIAKRWIEPIWLGSTYAEPRLVGVAWRGSSDAWLALVDDNRGLVLCTAGDPKPETTRIRADVEPTTCAAFFRDRLLYLEDDRVKAMGLDGAQVNGEDPALRGIVDSPAIALDVAVVSGQTCTGWVTPDDDGAGRHLEIHVGRHTITRAVEHEVARFSLARAPSARTQQLSAFLVAPGANALEPVPPIPVPARRRHDA